MGGRGGPSVWELRLNEEKARSGRRGWLWGACLALVLGLGGASLAHPGGPTSAGGAGPERARSGVFAHVPKLAEPAPPEAPEFEEPYYPFLADEDASQSVSVGDTSHGWIVNANPLRESERLGILPRQRKRQLGHGTEELAGLLEEAATTLWDQTKTRLWIGNVGRRGGGDIAWSVSHNSGRDADVAFCYLGADGKPADPPDLVPLDEKGVSTDGKLRFDVARTWIVVRSLLVSSTAQVQYLFISHPLKKKLLAHARAKSEPSFLYERASTVLRQPAGSHSHNDHLHVRVYCSRRDVGGGCEDTGPIHPWIELHDDARANRVASSVAALRDEDAAQRRAGLLRLSVLGAEDHGDEAAERLHDPDPAVRSTAARVLSRLGSSTHADALIARFRVETDDEARLALVSAMGTDASERTGALLRDLIATPAGGRRGIAALLRELQTTPPRSMAFFGAPAVAQGAPLLSAHLRARGDDDPGRLRRLRETAIDAAAMAGRLEPVESLLPLLVHEEGALRERAAFALRRIANHSMDVKWGDGAEDEEVQRGAERWRDLTTELSKHSRDHWLARGFHTAGFDVRAVDIAYVWELVRALGGPPHIAFNAEQALQRLSGEWADSGEWPRSEVCRFWLRTFDGNREKYDLKRSPPQTRRACWKLRASERPSD